MRKLKNTKRLISFALAFVMVCSFIPLTAFAADFVASTFSVISWRNAVESDGDGTKNIWCQFDSDNGFSWGAFQPESEACIKLVKAGKTESDAVNIGITNQNAFINETGGYCRIRYSQYWMNLMNVGGYGLPADGDYIIVEGKFKNGDNTITVPKTYIKLTADGDNLITSSTSEQPEELKGGATTIEVGSLVGTPSDHTTQTDEFIWTISDGEGVAETWVNYFADSDDCVQLLKAGTTTPVAIGEMDTSMTNEAVIVNRGVNTYCIRHSQWFLNCSGNSGTTPLEVGDVMIVGGNFTNANGTKIHITTTYIQKNEDGTFTFSTVNPCPNPITVGSLSAGPATGAIETSGDRHVIGHGSDSGATGWTVYHPCSADTIKLIKSGTTEEEAISIGVTTLDMLTDRTGGVYSLNYSQYYMNVAGQNDYMPIAGDILIIDGNFFNGLQILTIEKTYIKLIEDSKGDLMPEFSTKLPALEVGSLSADSSNPTLVENGKIYSVSEYSVNDVWQFYYAESSDCVQIFKSGMTAPVSIGVLDGVDEAGNALTTDGIILNRGANTFCIQHNQQYLNCAGHSDITPMEAGDILIVGGNFTSANGTKIHITKTYIQMNEDGTYTFSETEPSRNVVVFYEDISAFRTEGSYTHPTRAGCVFSGWYEDEACTTPLGINTVSGSAYAKFVNQNVLRAKWQVSAGTTADSESTNLRLVTSVDSVQYRNVGFNIKRNGETYQNGTYTTKTVYSKIYGTDGTTVMDYVPSTSFCSESQYFMTLRIQGVKTDKFDLEWEVAPFWTTLDGTVVTGITNTFQISDDYT